jgi:O-antigen/teichoic acid export membrane protein
VRRQGAVKNAVWLVIGQGGAQGLSLIIFLALSRYVSKEDFGIVAVSLTIVECVRRVFIDPAAFGLNARTVIVKHDYDVCLTLLLIVSVTGSTLLWVFAGPLVTALGSPAAAPTLHVVAMLLIGFGLTATHGAWLSRHMQFRALALRAIISVLIGGVVGIGMAVGDFGLWSLVGQQFAINIVNVIALWLFVDWKPKLTLSAKDTRTTVLRTRHIAASAIWNSIANDSDLLFAAAFMGPAVAGVFNAAKRIMLAANLVLVNAISAVALPALADIEQGSQREQAFLLGLTIASAVTAPVFAGIAATAPEIVHLLLGQSWIDAAPILGALALSGYCLAIAQFATVILLISEQSHLDSLSSGLTAFVKLVVYAVAVHSGPVALALAVSITTLAATPVRMRFALRHLDLSWGRLGRALAPSFTGACGMAIVLLIIRRVLPPTLPAWLLLAIMVPTGMAAYMLLLRVLSPSLFRAAAATLFAPLRGRSLSTG